MGTSTTDRASGGGPRWLERLRTSGNATPAAGPERRLEELESELALLREENARLKVGRERPHERSLEERVRGLLPPPGERTGDADEPWELLIDCLMLRDGLVDACEALERGARDTRRRLDALLADRDRPVPGDVAARSGLEGVA